MKKSLLTLATFLVATAGFSQATKNLLPVNRLAETEKQIPASMLITSDDALRKNAPMRKAYDDNFYYLRPEGTFYVTLTPDWRSHQYSAIYTAPWYYIEFRNMSEGFPNAEWKIAGTDVGELFGDNAISGEDNGLLWSQNNRTIYPIPYIEDSESGKKFTLCEANTNGTRIMADSLT